MSFKNCTGKGKGKIKFEFYHDSGVWSIYITQDGKDIPNYINHRFRILSGKGKNAKDKSVNISFYVQIDSDSRFFDLPLIRSLAYDFGGKVKVPKFLKAPEVAYVNFPIAGKFAEMSAGWGGFYGSWGSLKDRKGFESSKKAQQAAKNFAKALALAVLD